MRRRIGLILRNAVPLRPKPFLVRVRVLHDERRHTLGMFDHDPEATGPP